MNNKVLLDRISAFAGVQAGVVGDLMLDRYIWGHASRISQEAPVPVVRVKRETNTPGGAANVVRNVLSLGGNAAAFGIVGKDDNGVKLCEHLRIAGAYIDGIIPTDHETTIKTRVIAGNQQVVRVDRENTLAIDDELAGVLHQRVEDCLQKKLLHGIILEDYAKGLLTPEFVQDLVQLAQKYNVPIALDPHPANPFKVKGLSLMTPNRAEAFALAGIYYQPGTASLADDRQLLEVGKKLLAEWEVELLLITLGSDGMALFQADEQPLQIQTRAQEVFDVSGAGDTVMATFMLSRLAGAGAVEAAHLANHAAGIVVGKVGTASVTAEELELEIAEAYE